MNNRYGQTSLPNAVEEVMESRTASISNQIDNTLKTIEMLTCMVRDRADSMLGNEPEAKLGRESEANLKSIDRGAMDRIQRQLNEVQYSLDSLEFQVRRLNRL